MYRCYEKMFLRVYVRVRLWAVNMKIDLQSLSLGGVCDNCSALSYSEDLFPSYVCGTGMFAMRRYPRPAPEEQALRSSVGVCEPRASQRLGTVVRSLYSTAKGKKNRPQKWSVFLWLGNRDSNPNKQSQSLSCCRYTIPQDYWNGLYCSTTDFVCQ